MDVAALKQANPLSEIIGKDIKLIKNGREYTACCPFHGENTPSFTINDDKGFFHCFGCGKHGDVVDYIMESRNVEFYEACKILGNEQDFESLNQSNSTPLEKIDIYAGYIPIIPVPENVPILIAGEYTPKIINPKRPDLPAKAWKPSRVYPYTSKDKKLLGYVLRADLKNGGKITPTVLWCKQPDGTEKWTLISFPKPRPLYIVGELKPGKQIIISAEGEKSAEAIHKLTDKIAIAWPQGSNNIEPVEWEQLKGFDVLIWPDKDEAGIKSANKVAEILYKIGMQRIRILTPPSEIINGIDIYEKGWDAYDALYPKNNIHKPWDYEKFKVWAKEAAITYQLNKNIDINQDVKSEPAEGEKSEKTIKKKQDKKEKSPTPTAEDFAEQFKILGHNEGTYFYFPRATEQLTELTAPQHTYLNMYKLQDLHFWNIHFPGRGEPMWKEAANALIGTSHLKGVFMPHEKKRGRGAWLDSGRKIFHLGNKMLIDGQEYKFFDVKTEYVYEATQKIKLPNLNTLSNNEAIKLVKICEELEWENKLSGKLLAGWCVIAPVCGMLEWRPHIWITGAPDTGKSFAVKFIIRNMTQLFAMNVDGGTTEAAIRRGLRKDAMPVIFDEAEAKGQKASAMMESVLFYMRKASSGSTLQMVRKDNQLETFIIRSAFCLSSIDTNIEDEADDTRITQLNLKKNFADPQDIYQKFNILKDSAINTFTPEYASGMIMRAFNNIEILLDNIKIFEKAALETFTQTRHALQLAPLIAGAYLCHSLNRISLEDAKKWIAGHDWQDILPQEAEKDSDRLFNILMSHKMRFPDGSKSVQKTVGQIIIAINKLTDNYLLYHEELKQLGIEVVNNEDAIYIANQSPEITKILKDTSWHKKKWGKTLKRIPGALPVEGRYWAPGIKNGTRGISLPLALIRDNSVKPIKPSEDLGEEINFEEV